MDIGTGAGAPRQRETGGDGGYYKAGTNSYNTQAFAGTFQANYSKIVVKLEVLILENMTLISNDTEAEAEPTEGRLVILEEDVDSITINTDLKAYVSLDDGGNWEQVTLTDEGDFDGSKRILVGSKSLTDRDDKTMVYKIETLNSKECKIHGTGMFWR